MRRLPIILAAAAVAGAASAQPLDKPPRVDQAPRVEIKGADTPLTEPDASELLAPRNETKPEVRIEQRRQGMRVREIIVTPAGRTYSYTIQNREGQMPLWPQELSSGLSNPRFLKFEF